MSRRCVNCEREVAEGTRFCPHCGAAEPPPLSGEPRMLTGNSGGEVSLGIVSGIFLPFLLSVPTGFILADIGQKSDVAVWAVPLAIYLVAPLLVWLGLRRRYPIMAKAFAWTTLIVYVVSVLVIGGLLLLCAAAFKHL